MLTYHKRLSFILKRNNSWFTMVAHEEEVASEAKTALKKNKNETNQKHLPKLSISVLNSMGEMQSIM